MTQSYIPSGLNETVGFANEATVGTFVTPARWIPHKTATFNLKKITAQSEALQGSRFKQGSRRVLVAKEVTGSVDYELADAQFGLLLQHCLGSSATATGDAIATTVASGSNTGEISTVAAWSAPSAGVLDVAASTAFPASGSFTVATSSTVATCNYTGKGVGTLTGVTYVSGSATGTVSTGGAVTLIPSLYTQVHIPGFMEAQSLSFQKGIPFTSGLAIQPMSYSGVKIVDWSIACAVGGIATLQLTVDAWAENSTGTPALTSPTYLSGASVPNLLNWGSGSLLLGGTVVSGPPVSVTAGAAPVGIVKNFSVKGTNVLATDRFNLGSQVKAEQLTNGFGEITGDIEIEFANLSDFYSAFAADSQVAVQINLTSPVTEGTTYTSGLSILIPSVRFEGESPNASGPGVISVKVPFTALVDNAGDPIIQLTYTSTDSAV
jgi:hypothetical protein